MADSLAFLRMNGTVARWHTEGRSHSRVPCRHRGAVLAVRHRHLVRPGWYQEFGRFPAAAEAVARAPPPVWFRSASPHSRRAGRSAELGRGGPPRPLVLQRGRPRRPLRGPVRSRAELADRSRRLQSLEPSVSGGDNRETPILWIREDCCVQLVTGCEPGQPAPIVLGSFDGREDPVPPIPAGFAFAAGFATGSGIHDVDPNCGYNLNTHHLRVSWDEPTTLQGFRR